MTVLTVAQATVRFLEAQYTERDGVERPFFAGCWGIFGHGNVAGVGQALLEREQSDDPSHLRFFHGRNEQAMVHAAVAYARQRDRLVAMAVTASVGPGEQRAWLICDDPSHTWIRDTWADQAVDPRLPFGKVASS